MRTKPEAERKRFALAVSGGLTFLIALFWLTANLSSGTFAVRIGAPAQSSSTGLAGAGAALFVPDTSEARLEAILPPAPEPVVEEKKTVIPF